MSILINHINSAYPPLLLVAEQPCSEMVLYAVLIALFIIVIILYVILRALVDKCCCVTERSDCIQTNTSV